MKLIKLQLILMVWVIVFAPYFYLLDYLPKGFNMSTLCLGCIAISLSAICFYMTHIISNWHE